MLGDRVVLITQQPSAPASGQTQSDTLTNCARIGGSNATSLNFALLQLFFSEKNIVSAGDEPAASANVPHRAASPLLSPYTRNKSISYICLKSNIIQITVKKEKKGVKGWKCKQNTNLHRSNGQCTGNNNLRADSLE